MIPLFSAPAAGGRPFACLYLILPHGAERPRVGDLVYRKLTVEVLGLMLEQLGQVSGGAHRAVLAVDGVVLDRYVLVAPHLEENDVVEGRVVNPDPATAADDPRLVSGVIPSTVS